MLWLHGLAISIYIYIKSRFTSKEAAILDHRVSNVTQNMDLLMLW